MVGVANDGRTFIACNGANDLTEFDAVQGTVGESIPTGGGPYAVVVLAGASFTPAALEGEFSTTRK